MIPPNLYLPLPLGPALRALAEAEAGPDPEVLRAAPHLDVWQPVLTPQRELCLTGQVSGHPTLTGTDRWIVTSPLLALAPDRSWARTLNRFYRLGRMAEVQGRDMLPGLRFPEGCESVDIADLDTILEVITAVILDVIGREESDR